MQLSIKSQAQISQTSLMPLPVLNPQDLLSTLTLLPRSQL
jgi:hypothetical protein